MITLAVIIGATVALIAYDIWAAWDDEQPTITQAIQKYSRQYPVIPFAFGFLMGHLFGDF